MDFGPGPALAGLEPEQITTAVERAWYGLGRLYTSAPGYEVLNRPGYTLLRSLKPGASVSHAFDINLADEALDKTLADLRAEKRPPGSSLKCWLAPGSRPNRLESRLLQTGGRIGMVMSAMALDLKAWPGNTPGVASTSATARPQRVENRDLISGGLLLFGHSLGSDERSTQDRADLFCRLDCGPEGHFSHFVITDGSGSKARVAATTTIQYSGDVAAVLFVASREDLRGQGLAKACMVAALNEAAARGAGLAVLQATELGQPLYHHLGFHSYDRLLTVEISGLSNC